MLSCSGHCLAFSQPRPLFHSNSFSSQKFFMWANRGYRGKLAQSQSHLHIQNIITREISAQMVMGGIKVREICCQQAKNEFICIQNNS